MNDSRAFSKNPETPPSGSLVVGIGASAGGLEALGRFFDNVPRESGMAFVVVGHPGGDAWMLADELLAKHTELPIHRVESGMQVSADQVYLIPPGTPMTLSGGRLLRAEPPRGTDSMHSIDAFFRALAEDCGPRGAAVVLSGAGPDGSQGLRDVHDAGGLVVLQDAASASFDAGPAAAIDWVLSPAEIPRVLADHARKQSARARPSEAMATPRRNPSSEHAFEHDFEHAFEHSEVRRVPPPVDGPAFEQSSTRDLESLLASLSDAVYFKDASGKFLRTNQAMADRLGLSDPRDAIGKRAGDMPNSAAALALHRDDELLLKSGEAQHFHLERWEAPGGAVDWALVTRLPLRDRSGAIIGMIGVFHDVTDQKRAEEKVQEAVRRRDQFLAMLSHELRNPLGAIVTAAALLKKQLAEGEHARPLAILQRQSLQMARLLDDLLEASRVTENAIELRRAIVDLRTVAAEASEAARPFMEGGRVAFAANLGPVPIWVDGDPARLQQIQTNLLQNAAKYTPAGGHVTLVLEREGESAVVRVRDNGVGIAKEMLESVFDLFVQTGRKIDRAQGGIGLGLTLVRSLVAMHGGTVEALSEGEGKGAEFVVRLPLATAPAGTEPALEPSPRARSRLPKHAKLAIIEDNADNREMLVEALSLAGFRCQSADNGVDGLVLIDKLRPDVAIIDLGLPGMNGFELARRIRSDPQYASLRLVALTGYGTREDRTRALVAGFDEHLVKPIEPVALIEYLETESR
jgi:PAS domain S-box-containing protein